MASQWRGRFVSSATRAGARSLRCPRRVRRAPRSRSAAAPLPTPRDHLAAAVIEGRVCAVGGRKLSLLQNLAAFECYDPAADAWQAMPDAPRARGGVGAATIGARMFVAGGEQPLGTFKEVDIFDSVAGKWTRGP